MPHYVYIARCSDDSLYTGTSTNVEERMKTHNSGKGAKYTRSRLPVELLYTEQCKSIGAARSREASIKKLSRKQKLDLVGGTVHALP